MENIETINTHELVNLWLPAYADDCKACDEISRLTDNAFRANRKNKDSLVRAWCHLNGLLQDDVRMIQRRGGLLFLGIKGKPHKAFSA